jgi:hypothetical protein
MMLTSSTPRHSRENPDGGPQPKPDGFYGALGGLGETPGETGQSPRLRCVTDPDSKGWDDD